MGQPYQPPLFILPPTRPSNPTYEGTLPPTITHSRFLREGTILSVVPLPQEGHLCTVTEMTYPLKNQTSIVFTWQPTEQGFAGGYFEMGIRTNSDCPYHMSPTDRTVMMYLKLNQPGTRIHTGTKEGFIAFLSVIATIEATARLLRKSLGGTLFHVERAVRENGGMLGDQVALGNYNEISADEAGYSWTDYIGGYYSARYPMGDTSLEAFAIMPVAQWLKKRALMMEG